MRAAKTGPPSPSRAIWDTDRWRKVRARVIREWVAEHGHICPGWQRPPHASGRLTCDHITALAAGGAPFDPANLTVLCVGCNGRKGGPRRR